MRIDGYGPTLIDSSKPVNVKPAAKVANQTAALSTSAPVAVDKTTLSTSTEAVQSLTQSALATANLRAAKVEALKQAVNSAQYQLDSAKIAEALSNGAV